MKIITSFEICLSVQKRLLHTSKFDQIICLSYQLQEKVNSFCLLYFCGNGKTMNYKTWSSVSNSNLSKTFALGSLEILKFRSSVLSLQRSFSLKIILGQKKFWVKKNLCLKKFCIREKFGHKKLWVWNLFRSNKFFVLKKFWVPKKCLVHCDMRHLDP